jgi:hypothetical protein
VTVISLPLIHRQGQQRPGQGLLQQNYLANLAILLGLIAAATALLYVVARAHRPKSLRTGRRR